MSKITLGILGGGQLGSMLSVAAKKLSIKTIIFCTLSEIIHELSSCGKPSLQVYRREAIEYFKWVDRRSEARYVYHHIFSIERLILGIRFI